MLIPLERMRVGISSERASQTHTPGPSAKNPITETDPEPPASRGSRRAPGDQGFLDLQRRGLRGLQIAQRIFEEGHNLVGGTQLARVISMGRAAGSSERTKLVVEVKSP